MVMRRAVGRVVVSFSILLIGTVQVFGEVADQRLIEAAAAGDLASVRSLIGEGVDVDTPRADGVTALIWAAHRDDVAMTILLLRAGADVNAADDHGVTALERASENASLSMAALLLGAGADPNAAQASGLTPLMTASRTGNVELVDALLAAGAGVNSVTVEVRSTPLMWAVSEPHPAIIETLLGAGADPHASTAKGLTPLLYAVRNGDIETIEMLMDAGVDVNETGVDDTQALPFAIISGQGRTALFLLEQGADPNGSLGGVHALHAAAGNVSSWMAEWYRRHGRNSLFGRYRQGLSMEQRLTLVNTLLERGADPNARATSWAMFHSYIGYPTKGAFEPFQCGTGNLQGATPLWVAAYAANGRGIFGGLTQNRVESSSEIIRALLAAGADHRLTTHDGTTPLMMAAGLGQSTFTPGRPRGVRSPSAEEAVKVLVEAGADIHAVNEADFTALHGAAFRGLNEVIEYLVEIGANIDARDFRGRTAYRMAEGSKQSFQFQSWPETAELLKRLGANTRLGIPGTVQERLRDVLVAEGRELADQQ
jgi:ankyrin repeat protein